MFVGVNRELEMRRDLLNLDLVFWVFCSRFFLGEILICKVVMVGDRRVYRGSFWVRRRDGYFIRLMLFGF